MATTTTPANAGKFKPGKSGNPAGSKTGSRNKVTVAAENLFQKESNAIARCAVEMALNGNPGMIKLILERVVPIKKSSPIKIPGLPVVATSGNASQLTSFILSAVSSGTISPLDGEIVSRIAEKHLHALHVSDLESRLKKLEEKIDQQ